MKCVNRCASECCTRMCRVSCVKWTNKVAEAVWAKYDAGRWREGLRTDKPDCFWLLLGDWPDAPQLAKGAPPTLDLQTSKNTNQNLTNTVACLFFLFVVLHCGMLLFFFFAIAKRPLTFTGVWIEIQLSDEWCTDVSNIEIFSAKPQEVLVRNAPCPATIGGPVRREGGGEQLRLIGQSDSRVTVVWQPGAHQSSLAPDLPTAFIHSDWMTW